VRDPKTIVLEWEEKQSLTSCLYHLKFSDMNSVVVFVLAEPIVQHILENYRCLFTKQISKS
jgi:hypothetical protein